MYYGSFAPADLRLHNVQVNSNDNPQTRNELLRPTAIDHVHSLQIDKQVQVVGTEPNGEKVYPEPKIRDPGNPSLPLPIEEPDRLVSAVLESPKDIQAPQDLAIVHVHVKRSTTFEKDSGETTKSPALVEALQPQAAPILHQTPSPALSTFKRSTTSVVILACKRPHYLEQTLDSLMRLDGIGEYDVVISQDGHHQGVKDLAASFVRRHANIRPALARVPPASSVHPNARTHARTHAPKQTPPPAPVIPSRPSSS